jgi:CcmD family protein
MLYLFGAFFVLWATTFGYVYLLHVRQKRLEQELDAIRDHSDRSLV